MVKRVDEYEDDMFRVGDNDDTYSDFDLCEWCSCPRSAHQNGEGDCAACSRCEGFESC